MSERRALKSLVKAAPARAARMTVTSTRSKKTVFAFGFDKLGFSGLSQEDLIVDDVRIALLPYGDPRRLDEADGLIVPSGIFESIEDRSSVMGVYVEVRCDRGHLLTRFRECVNLIHQGGWICCLVEYVTDHVPQGHSSFKCRDTDLVKKLMNAKEIDRAPLPAGVIAYPKSDEFKEYIRRWGVAKTMLQPGGGDHRTLSTAGRLMVGVECDSQILFLPFHHTRKDGTELKELVVEVTDATESYLRKRAVALPNWVDRFEFASERRIAEESQALMDRLLALEATQLKWRQYKGLLVRSGDALRETLAAVLRDYFGLSIDDQDVGIEDLAVKDADGKILCVIEAKGTNSGLKREHINQVDSHRERHGLSASIPGVLMMNDFKEVEDLGERRAKPVAQEHVAHSRRLNVLVVRSVDLLELMRGFESLSLEVRQAEWKRLCESGGGLLRRDADGRYSATE